MRAPNRRPPPPQRAKTPPAAAPTRQSTVQRAIFAIFPPISPSFAHFFPLEPESPGRRAADECPTSKRTPSERQTAPPSPNRPTALRRAGWPGSAATRPPPGGRSRMWPTRSSARTRNPRFHTDRTEARLLRISSAHLCAHLFEYVCLVHGALACFAVGPSRTRRASIVTRPTARRAARFSRRCA